MPSDRKYRHSAEACQVGDNRPRKPDGIHERIERLVAGPYLELFARQSRPGWTTWGNEATKFDRPYDAAANSKGCYDVAIEALRKKAEGE